MAALAIRHATLLSFFLAGVFSSAASAAGRLAPDADTYVKSHGLHARAVKIDLPDRRAQRIFVPVLPTTVEDFTVRFTKKAASMIVRQAEDLDHVAIVVDERRAVGFKTITFTPANRYVTPESLPPSSPMSPAHGGRYLVLDLDGGLRASFEQYLSTVTPETVPHEGGLSGGCMWWLVHAQVTPNVKLAHAMGVTQSRAPSNLIKKFLHAGNDRITVVGVGVPSLAAFDAMSDATLLGPPPGGGPEEAVKN
jgi:hypothetical protein